MTKYKLKSGIVGLGKMGGNLAVEGGYVHAGLPGAGHFVKLVHNGIEFGMLQAIGEGIDLLTHYKDDLDIAGVMKPNPGHVQLL